MTAPAPPAASPIARPCSSGVDNDELLEILAAEGPLSVDDLRAHWFYKRREARAALAALLARGLVRPGTDGRWAFAAWPVRSARPRILVSARRWPITYDDMPPAVLRAEARRDPGRVRNGGTAHLQPLLCSHLATLDQHAPVEVRPAAFEGEPGVAT
ncbi:MAG: hypothetical protein OHK0024_21140 [Thalassobaculales bacterium]